MYSQAQFDIRWGVAVKVLCQLYIARRCFATLRNEMHCEPHGTPALTQFMSMSCSDLVLLTRLQQQANLQHMLPRLQLSLPTEAWH